MVQTITIPLSWANNIPGVSGIQDVVFDVPELSDIEDAIVNNTLDRTDIDEAILDQIDDIADEVAQQIDIDVPTVDIPAVDVFAQAFIEELTDLRGFFGPVEGDFQRALQDVLGDPGQPLAGLDLDLTGVTDRIDALETTVGGLDVPSLSDIQDAAEEAVRDVLEALPGGDLLTDPDDFIDDQLDRLLDRAVDPGTETDLEDAVTRTTDKLDDAGIR